MPGLRGRFILQEAGLLIETIDGAKAKTIVVENLLEAEEGLILKLGHVSRPDPLQIDQFSRVGHISVDATFVLKLGQKFEVLKFYQHKPLIKQNISLLLFCKKKNKKISH